MNLSNNTILLTCGTSGIGLELLRKFYSLNNKIIVASSNPENLNNLRTEFPHVSTVVCDLGDTRSVKELLEHCLNTYPELNILINNAGIQYNYNWMVEEDGFHKISRELKINFTSPLYLIYGLLPLLANQREAAVINVSSALAFHPKKSAPVYCASKAAIHNVSKSLRYQLADSTVKVFEIIPPLVDTPMTAGRGSGKLSPKELADEFIRNFKRNKYESYIGKSKVLRLLARISPKIADNMLKNG